MHRTTTTATLLVTVAVSALTGCVTVQQGPPAPGAPPAAPYRPSAPRPDGRAGTQVVQAPVQEALEMVGASRKPGPKVPPQRPRSTPDTGGGRSGRSQAAQPHTQGRGAGQPHVDLDDLPGRVSKEVSKEVRRNTDVCALGKKYGGWRADSPEAVICEQASGR